MVKSLVEELELIVKANSNDYPPPKKCIIKDIYPDGKVDVTVSYGDTTGTIVYRSCIGTPVINDEAVLVFIDGKINDGYVICTSKGGSGGSKAVFTYDSLTGDLCVEYEDNLTTIVTYNDETGDLCVEYA